MNDLETILNQAKEWLGYNEKDGSFKVIIDTYNSYKPLPRGYAVKYSDEWCATFISALGIKHGLTDIIYPECGCGEMIKLFKNHGISLRKDNPKVGDITFYSWHCNGVANHVGIIADVSYNGMLSVIEGNKSESVGYRQLKYTDSTILGFVTPKYKVEDNPSTWAKDAWDKATELKIMDGTRPHDALTREELAVVLERVGLLDK